MSAFRHAFAHPYILFALWSLPVLTVLGILARRRTRRVLAQFGATGLRNALFTARGGPRWLRASCLSMGLLSLGLASAGPQWGREWNQTTAPGRDLVVVLDMSRSMLAEQPSRLSRATDALQNLCDTLQQRGGHRIALVVFAGRAKVICPLTHDYDHFRDAVAGQPTAALPRPEREDQLAGPR